MATLARAPADSAADRTRTVTGPVNLGLRPAERKGLAVIELQSHPGEGPWQHTWGRSCWWNALP